MLSSIAQMAWHMLAAKIDDSPGVGQTVRDPPLIRHRFMRGLGSGRASPLDA